MKKVSLEGVRHLWQRTRHRRRQSPSTLVRPPMAPPSVNESIANACNHGHVHSASASDMSKTSVIPRAIIIANDHMNLEKTCQSHGMNVICCTSFAPFMRSGRTAQGLYDKFFQQLLSNPPELLWLQYHRTHSCQRTLRTDTLNKRVADLVKQQVVNHVSNPHFRLVIEGPYGFINWSLWNFLDKAPSIIYWCGLGMLTTTGRNFHGAHGVCSLPVLNPVPCPCRGNFYNDSQRSYPHMAPLHYGKVTH